MRGFGRILQHLGLIAAPAAIALQLAEAINVKQMLQFWIVALCLFWIGRLVEGYGPKGGGMKDEG